MTPGRRQLAASLAACSALAFGACGSSDEPEGDPLPRDTVALLQTRLDEIERRYQDAIDNGNVGACNDIGSDSIPAVEEAIAGLPASVDPELRDAVEQSFARLRELTDEGCADVEPVETEPAPAPEPEPVPEDTITEEEPPEEPTTPVEPPPEPDENKDKDKENKKDKDKDQGGGSEAPVVIEEEG